MKLSISEIEARAKNALEYISSGVLPNGDHVEGATSFYAEKVLAKVRAELGERDA